MAEFINFINGVDASVPKNSVFYLMATDDSPQTQPPFPVTVGVSVVQGPVVQTRMQQPPQLNPNLIFASQAADSSVPKNVANWIQAVTDDPSTDANWLLSTDLLNNQPCNFPPQIGSGGV